MLVNIALVSQGRPDSRITRTASATDSLTPPVASAPAGLMLIATITGPPCHAPVPPAVPPARPRPAPRGSRCPDQRRSQRPPRCPGRSVDGRVLGMIILDSLTKTYGRFAAVDQVSFRAEPGRVTGFLGPNGAGKSTTMRILVGLTP